MISHMEIIKFIASIKKATILKKQICHNQEVGPYNS